MSDSTIAQGFYTEFEVARNGQFEILHQIRAHGPPRVARLIQISDFTTRLSTAGNSHVSELSAQLALLRKQFVDARPFLPPYDQRRYEMQLKAWEQTLEKLQVNLNSTGTKPKFAFKRKDKPKEPPADVPEVEAPILAETINRSPTTSHLSLASKSGCLLTRKSFPDASSTPIDSELIITNLDNCIVDLMDSNNDTTSPIAVHIRNVANCVLLLPIIRGSVLLYELQRCVVAIPGCHQFRMHTSERVDAYLPTAVKPVIEGCIEINFSGHPASSPASADKPTNEFQVEDFSHIRQTPSPNWLPRNDKTATLDNWLEKFRGSGRDAKELDLQMLDEILPCVRGEGSG